MKLPRASENNLLICIIFKSVIREDFAEEKLIYSVQAL